MDPRKRDDASKQTPKVTDFARQKSLLAVLRILIPRENDQWRARRSIIQMCTYIQTPSRLTVMWAGLTQRALQLVETFSAIPIPAVQSWRARLLESSSQIGRSPRLHVFSKPRSTCRRPPLIRKTGPRSAFVISDS